MSLSDYFPDLDDREFSDDDARQLLRLLHKYQREYAPDLPTTVPALAEDLAQTLEQTTDVDDLRSREIQMAWSTHEG